MVRMSRIGGKTFWEKFTQKAPGCAGLERAVPGIFVFGIFGNAANDEFAEPALDHEGGEVKWVFFPFEERGGIVEIAHEGKRGEVRSGECGVRNVGTRGVRSVIWFIVSFHGDCEGVGWTSASPRDRNLFRAVA